MNNLDQKFKKALANDTGYVVENCLGDGALSKGVFKLRMKTAFIRKLRRKVSNEKIDIESDNDRSRTIALKVCKEKYEALLHHEYLIMSELDHVNVLKVLAEPRKIRNRCGLMLELVDGSDLFFVLKSFYEFEDVIPKLPAVRHIAKSVLLGLKYLNEKEVVHNDIKPENILIGTCNLDDVTANVPVKLCDFGLASDAKDKYGNAGSPHWASPEKLFRGAESSTHASDMFSFGYVFYTMCTGFMIIKLTEGNQPKKFMSITQKKYMAQWEKFCERTRHAKSGFLAEWPAAKELPLSTTHVDPSARLTASQALQLEFFNLIE